MNARMAEEVGGKAVTGVGIFQARWVVFSSGLS